MTNGERNPKPECRNSLDCAVAGLVIRISMKPERGLMIKQELFRIDQRPDNVLISVAPSGQRFFIVLVGAFPGDVLLGQGQLISPGAACIRRQVKLAELFLIAPFRVGREARGDALVVRKFLLNFPGVEQVETLGEAGVLRTLALARAR